MLLSEREFSALVDIIRRAPMSNAEAIGVEVILTKVKPEPAPTLADKQA